MAASVATAHRLQEGAGAWSLRQALSSGVRVRSASAAAKNEHAAYACLRLAPCSSCKLARSVGASSWRLPLQRRTACRCRCLVVAASTIQRSEAAPAKTSKQLASASNSHFGVAASLLDQSELHDGGVRCKDTLPPAGADGWSSQQSLSTGMRASAKTSKRCACVRLRLAPDSSRKLDRSVGASSWRLPLQRHTACRSRCLFLAASTLHRSVIGVPAAAKTSTQLSSASNSHRAACGNTVRRNTLRSFSAHQEGGLTHLATTSAGRGGRKQSKMTCTPMGHLKMRRSRVSKLSDASVPVVRTTAEQSIIAKLNRTVAVIVYDSVRLALWNRLVFAFTNSGRTWRRGGRGGGNKKPP